MPARKGGELMIVVALLLLSVVPRDDVSRESVDLVELNHFYDENGRLVFDQVIFWDWSERDARYQVAAWRLVKHEVQLPRPDCCGRKFWTVLWQDGDRHRAITAHAYRETWTQYDPELAEREYLPAANRRELRGKK
jgi:hypothetical protein